MSHLKHHLPGFSSLRDGNSFSETGFFEKNNLLRHLLIIILYGNMFNVVGQEFFRPTKLDSLEQLLTMKSSYAAKIPILGELSDYWIYQDSAKAMQYALEIKQLATKNKDSRASGIAHYYIGGIYLEYYHFKEAEKEHLVAENLLKSDTSFYGQQILSKTYHNHGAIYQRQGDEDTYLNYVLNHAIPIQKKINDSLTMAKNYHNIGMVFMNIKNYGRAIRYYENAIKTLQYYPRLLELSEVHLRLAQSIIYKEDFSEIRRKQVAEQLRKAEDVLNHHPNSYSWVSYYQTKGLFEESFQKNLSAALESYLNGYNLAKELNEHRLVSHLLTRMYYIYFMQGDYVNAKICSYENYENYQDYFTPRDQLITLKNMANCQEKLGNLAEAFNLSKVYLALSDSISAKETALKIVDLEQKYESKKKENEILDLTLKTNSQSLIIKNRQFWLLMLIAILLILIASFVIVYLIYLNKKQAAENEKKMLKQNVENLKNEQELRVMEGVVEGQNQERKRIATDLHDGLGGTLSGIKMKLAGISLQKGKEKVEVEGILNLLDESINDLRSISKDLMPESLLNLGIFDALTQFCKRMENKNTRVILQTFGSGELMPQSFQIMIFRIVQELVTNAVKHAKASEVLVQCNLHGNEVFVTVEDNGIGFHPLSVNGKGLGLDNVRTRVENLNGRIDIDSHPGLGTTFNIEFAY